MDRKERETEILNEQQKVQFANELKDLQDNPVLQKIFDGFAIRRAEYQKVIDNLSLPLTSEKVQEARLRRAAITWLFETWINAIHEGEVAQERINRWKALEDKLDGRKPGGETAKQ